MTSPMLCHAVRLRPGDDLKASLRQLCLREGWRAAAIVTAVGSLTRVALRYANRPEATIAEGFFEIVSLVGTLDAAGLHLHLCVSDGDGRTAGGHVLDGCLIYTTAEIVVGELTALEFRREHDPASGYKELVVSARESADASGQSGAADSPRR